MYGVEAGGLGTAPSPERPPLPLLPSPVLEPLLQGHKTLRMMCNVCLSIEKKDLSKGMAVRSRSEITFNLIESASFTLCVRANARVYMCSCVHMHVERLEPECPQSCFILFFNFFFRFLFMCVPGHTRVQAYVHAQAIGVQKSMSDPLELDRLL